MSDSWVPTVTALLLALGSSLVLAHALARSERTRASRRLLHLVGEASASGAIPEENGSQAGGRNAAASATWAGVVLAVPPGALRALLLGFLGAALVTLVTVGWVPALVLASLAVPIVLLDRIRGLHSQHLEQQCAPAVSLFASGLRAGHSVPQAVALVARETPEPTGSQFAMTAREIDLGLPLEEAVTRLATRTRSPDYRLVSVIVAVQHEVGGNLAQALDAVVETLRERHEVREQAWALTAQQRLSSVLLTGLPVGLFVFLMLFDRSFIEPMLGTPVGRVLLALDAGLLALGWKVMRSMGQVDI